MRRCWAGRLPPRGEAGRGKDKDRERSKDHHSPNPTEVHVDPPGWVNI